MAAITGMQMLVELIGSFVLFAVIMTNGQPIPIAAALLAVCYLGSGHYNPAVSLMKLVTRDINGVTFSVLLLMQLLAAVLAVVWAKNFA